MSDTQSKEHGLLRKHYVSLIDHVDTVLILDSLFQDGVIEIDDYERVRSGQTTRDRIRSLLTILWRKISVHKKTFYDFVTILKTDYDYLAIINEAEILKKGNDTATVPKICGEGTDTTVEISEKPVTQVGSNSAQTDTPEATDSANAKSYELEEAVEPAIVEHSAQAPTPVAPESQEASTEKPTLPDETTLLQEIKSKQESQADASLGTDFANSLLSFVRNMTSDSCNINHRGRELRYQVKGGFYRWKWVWQGTVTDVTTGVSGRSHNKHSRGGALEDAIRDLVHQLDTR